MATDPSSPSSPSPRQNPPSQAGSPSASSPSGASASSSPAAPSDPPPSPSRPPIPPVPPPPSNPGAAGSDADTDRLAAASPTTPAAELLRIAASRPDLHPALATNPATYPDLVDWLRTSPDPAVQAALAQRASASAQPEPAQAQAEAPTWTADASTNPSTSTAPAPAAKTKRRAGLSRPAASADSGADAGSTAPPAPRTRRRPRMGIIAAILVAVLVLVGGAAIAVKKLHGGTGAQATSSASGWAGEWRQIWKFDAADGRSFIGRGNQLVIFDSSTNSTLITSYDVSGDSLNKQWETAIEPNPKATGVASSYWGNYIIYFGYLIDAVTGEQTPWPWPIDAHPDIIDNYAVNCDDADQCTAWGSERPHQVLWTKTIPGVEERYLLWQNDWAGSIYNQNGTTIVRFGDYTLVNLATGETYPIDIPLDSSQNHTNEYDTLWVSSLSDGWAFEKGKVRVLASPTGEVQEVINTPTNETHDTRYIRTNIQPYASIEQYRSYLTTGDTSWAEVAATTTSKWHYKFRVSGSTSEAIRYEDFDNYDGEFIFLSDDRSVLILGDIRPSNIEGVKSSNINGMWRTDNGRRIDLPKQYDHFYMVNPDLIVAQDDTGELVAYRPAGK